jgi:hypothetical protein
MRKMLTVRTLLQTKKVTCPHCDQTFATPHRLDTHLQYRHPDKSPAATAPPMTAAPKGSAAPAPVVAPNASAQQHLQTALQELTKRQRDIDEQLSTIMSLQSEKQAITKQIDAVKAAMQAFE